MNNDERFTEWAMKILSLAQAGLAYSKNPYELERSRELKETALEMLAWQSAQPVESVRRYFAAEEGYITPKVDTRAALFRDGKILLVHENNGTWALPGGWCESTLSPAENAVKEMEEEAGYTGKPVRLIAVQDWKKHNPCDLPFGVVKIFIEVKEEGQIEADHVETSEAKFFSRDELPENLAFEKDTREQIEMCFDAHQSGERWKAVFD